MKVFQEHEIINPQVTGKANGLFILDFDGTLLRSDRTVAPQDLDALERLGELGIVRAIATGRSLYSFNSVTIPGLAIDFVIFSTGAGILQLNGGHIVRKVNLDPLEVERVSSVLKAHQLDFMIHRTIPENHRFAYYRSNQENEDFDRRLTLYSQHAEVISEKSSFRCSATQLLAIVPAGPADAILKAVRNDLKDFTVIQTTSPLDGKSTWIEIFPLTVSKSQTAAWLADELAIDKRQIVSVGNDYNDLDLLEWTDSSYVVDNAPEDLKNRFATVASNNNGGVTEAAKRWLDGNFKTPN